MTLSISSEVFLSEFSLSCNLVTLEKPAQWACASVHSSVSEGTGYLTALGFGEMQSVTRHIITFKDDLQPLVRSRCLERTLGSHGSKTLLEAMFIFAAAHGSCHSWYPGRTNAASQSTPLFLGRTCPLDFRLQCTKLSFMPAIWR